MLTIDIARMWYPAEDAVHGFDHVLRVYRMAERLAQAEGADIEIVRAAALLHDASPGNGAVLSEDVEEQKIDVWGVLGRLLGHPEPAVLHLGQEQRIHTLSTFAAAARRRRTASNRKKSRRAAATTITVIPPPSRIIPEAKGTYLPAFGSYM